MNLDTLPLEILTKICTEHGLGGLDLARLDVVSKSIHGRMLGEDSYKKLLYEGTDRRSMLATMDPNVTEWDILRREIQMAGMKVSVSLRKA
eukprot:jgi/Pico_ML_1/54806/g669.t1